MKDPAILFLNFVIGVSHLISHVHNSGINAHGYHYKLNVISNIGSDNYVYFQEILSI